MEQYRVQNDIKTVTLTTATPATEEFTEAVRNKVAASMPGMKIELTTKVKADLIGGFLLKWTTACRRIPSAATDGYQEAVCRQSLRKKHPLKHIPQRRQRSHARR
jgi:hypothetical protein